MITREDAIKILEELGNSPNMIKHAMACEAAMKALAKKFEPEKEADWALTGLLHDADYEATNKSLDRHTDLTVEKLQKFNASQEIIEAIKGHCDKTERKTLIAKAIYAADELTGLIVAAALVRPDKKLNGLTRESVVKRFKEPSFAKGVNREQIKTCETELGIPLPDFVEIMLSAMQIISDDLEL